MNEFMKPLRYAVIGTGALGGFFGGMLAKTGQEVHFLFHGDYDFVREHGLRVDSILGDFRLENIHAYKNTQDMPVCDVVLVCLKTTSDSLLKTLLTPLLHKETTVILIQNGLGNEQRLAVHFPDLSIAGALAFICSSKIGVGHIAHTDKGQITIGLHQGENCRRIEQVCADFEKACVPAQFSDNLAMSRWKKLVWNIPYNGLCVVMNATTAELMDSPPMHQLLSEIMLEVIAAANACNCPIDKGFAQAMLDHTTDMKPYAPSMKLDFDFKRPLEIEAIYSAPLDAAQKAGFDMPKTRMLKQQLQYFQSRYL
jgi:2-dehydropantoate 2-reductase